MKSSYKLYGDFWDGKPNQAYGLNVCLRNDRYEQTKLLLSEILKENDTSCLEKNKTEDLIVLIDYIPSEGKHIVDDFYICRLLQIVHYYNAEIQCEDFEAVARISSLINDYYKRKTPSRLLAQSDGVLQMIC